MKCYIKKLTALALALIIIVSLASCGCERYNPLVGKWNYKFSIKDFTETVIQFNKDSLDPSLQAIYGDILKVLDKFGIDVTLEFRDDGTFSFAPDVDAARAVVEKAEEKLKTILTKVFKVFGVNEDQIKAKEKSIDDIINSINKAIDSFEYSGKYVFENNKLYLYDEDKEKNDSQYLDIELAVKEFTVIKINGDVKGFQGMDALVPMTFKRV